VRYVIAALIAIDLFLVIQVNQDIRRVERQFDGLKHDIAERDAAFHRLQDIQKNP
jgi:hypothetical protein